VLTLSEALTGFAFTITHLDGRNLLIKSDPRTVYTPGSVKAIRDEGMPSVKNPYVRGSLFLEFDVQFPTADQVQQFKTQLRQCLPAPAPSDVEHKEGVEEVTLVDVDIEAEKRRMKEEQLQKEAYDEDDEGRRHGPGGAQCRAQ